MDMSYQQRCRCQKDRAPTAHNNQINGYRLISCSSSSQIQDPFIDMYYQRRCRCRDDDYKDRLIVSIKWDRVETYPYKNKKKELPPIKELKNLSLEDEENKKNHRSSSWDNQLYFFLVFFFFKGQELLIVYSIYDDWWFELERVSSLISWLILDLLLSEQNYVS
jgi:hypothetical protein